MPLDKAGLASDLKTLFTQLSTEEGDKSAALDKLVNGIVNAVDKYVKTATVIVQQGQQVQVAYPAGTGATITPGTGKLQ